MSQMVLTATLAALLGVTCARRTGLFGLALASAVLAAVAAVLAPGGIAIGLLSAVATVAAFQIAALAGHMLDAPQAPSEPIRVPALPRHF